MSCEHNIANYQARLPRHIVISVVSITTKLSSLPYAKSKQNTTEKIHLKTVGSNDTYIPTTSLSNITTTLPSLILFQVE
jgi:hypothetical protein